MKENEILKSESEKANGYINAMYCGYFYHKCFFNKDDECPADICLTLFDNGTFARNSLQEYQVGTYTISENKLVLTAHWNPMEELRNVIFEINSDYSQVIDGNVTLKRLN